jgi:gamma-glutamylcyclotransferase (GGCT)/AIG2-like uncharacterized protein YtfP
MTTLFVYGTLLDFDVLRRFVPPPLMLQPATLCGRRRVYLSGEPYPTLVPRIGHVRGALLRVDAAGLRRLRKYEGPRYRLVPVRPRVAHGTVRAHAWIAPGGTKRAWP